MSHVSEILTCFIWWGVPLYRMPDVIVNLVYDCPLDTSLKLAGRSVPMCKDPTIFSCA